MSKSRRKVTVDTAKSVSDDSEKRKPSVFERLGPGGGQRKYDYEAERMEKSSYVEKCRNWLLTGSCSFGSKCKFLHGPFTGGANAPEGRIRSSKRHESDNTDDIKLKLKSPRDKDDSLKNLDFKEELTLMRKRQELQRALNNLPAPPDEQRENLTIEKKVRRHILPGEHSVRVSSSESGSVHSSPEPSKQQTKKSMKPNMNPSSKKKDKKKHKASKSPLNKSKNAPCPDQMPKEKEKKRQISEERDVHHKVRMKKKKHKESLSETDNKSPDVPEPVRGHKMHSPLFDSGSSKSKLPLSPKHDWQKDIKPTWALEDGECYSVSTKKSRRSRSPSSGEKSRRKKSLSPSLEKRSKHSPMNVLPPERDSVVEKLSSRKNRTRGITPPEKVPPLSTSKDRSLSSDDERSAHSSIHDGEKRKNKKGRFSERMHVGRSSKSGKGDDRLLYSESSESRQNEWRNESPPPRERRERRNRDFTPERTLKASRSGSREHEKLERDSKLSKKKDGAKNLEPCPESRSDRKRQFKEDRLLPVCSPELQDPNYTKPRRLLPDPPEPAINPTRRGLSPKDSYTCHSRSPSRQRRGEGRDRSPFDVLQMRRKDMVSEDYRHDEQPPTESPSRNRLLPDNNYFPDNFDYSPGRQFIEHLNEDRRNERFMGYRSETRVESRYSQPAERYPFEERRRYNEEPIPTGYDERTHYDNSRNRTNRDLYERDRYERVSQSSRSDPRYEEAKEPLVYDRNLPPDYREPTTEVWEIRGRGRGRVNPRSRGRQSEATGHRGRGYAPPPEDRLSGLARDQFSGVAERPSRRSEWERHQEEYFGSEHVEWPDHRNERNLPPSHDDPRQELHDIPELRRGRRPDSRDEWRNGRRDAEDMYERRPELGTGLLMTPDRMEMRPERWENRQPTEAPRRPDLHKNDNKHDDRIDKRNLSPGEKERLDSRRKRPRDQDPEQSRSRSPSLKHHRENSPVDSFHSHSSMSDHRADGVGREWMQNRWPPPQSDPLGLREKEGCGDGGQWPGIRQRSPLQKHLLDKKRNKEWENNRAAREKELMEKDADRLKGKDRDKLKDRLEPDNQLLYPDGRMLMNRKNRPKKKEKRKRSLSKSPSLDGKDRKRVCRGMSPKGSGHDDKDKMLQPPQQRQELAFSDWSDDESADDILNRPEEPQELVVPLIEPHIKEDRFKHSPGRGSFMNQPIRQLHNPKEEYRMWQPHRERNSRYHWEKPNLSTQPRLPLGRALLERHHKDMVPDMCFRMKPDHLPRLLPDPEPMSDLRPPMDSSNHGNVVDIMPVIKQPLLGDAPGCVPLHSLANMPMPTPPINPMLLQNLLTMPHNMGHPIPMNTLAPPMPPVNPATFAAAAAVAVAAASSNTTTTISTTPTATTTTVTTPAPTSVTTSTTRNNSDINGLDLDSAGMQYEEISSEEESMEGELDLELLGVGGDKKKKKSIVDVLNIDWSHVMQTNRPKHQEKSGSALQRFWPGQIFSKIGVSRQFAGETLYQKLQDLCNKQLNEEQQKEQTATEGEEATNEGGEAAAKATTTAVEKFQFKNDIAALHMAMVKKAKERANLLHDVGPHRRALCARRDLEIRRQLCQVDKSIEPTSIYPNQIIDSELCKLSIQLFKQGHDSSLRKEPLLAKEVPCSS